MGGVCKSWIQGHARVVMRLTGSKDASPCQDPPHPHLDLLDLLRFCATIPVAVAIPARPRPRHPPCARYSAYHYSHPPLVERLKAIDRAVAAGAKKAL